MKTFILSFALAATGLVTAQNTVRDTLTLNRNNAENLFLENNLQLLAEKLNINIAEAQVIQAGIWPNPKLSVSDINLWSNATAEQLPVLWGNYGTTQEVALSLEQLIITAGKRKKMVAMEKVGADMAKEYFKDLLRNLKIEFRNSLTALQFNQAQQQVYKNQLKAMEKLLSAYSNQAKQGNISKSDYIRLKASELEFIKEINNLEKENNRLQKELKVLMNLNPLAYVTLTTEGFIPQLGAVENINVADLTASALKNRPDVRYAELTEQYADKKYKYERSLRTPDVTLQASYDRGGNIMNNFVGVGFALDLPFFNRNQGNIKAAKFSMEQSKLVTQEKTNTTQAEVIEAYSNLISSKKIYEAMQADYEKDLDQLLNSHLKNFIQRNTSLLEYLDYVEAYLENKEIILTIQRELNEHFEELKYRSGEELN